jgi:hypothetical protein
MRKFNFRIRPLIATLLAAVVMWLTLATFLLWDVDSSGNHSGLILMPAFFLITIFLCSAVANWLLSKGHSSFLHFALGASIISCIFASVISAPFLIIGSFIGIFPFSSALLPLLSFTAIFGLATLPSAAVWWLIAGKTHNNYKQRDCRTLRTRQPLL